MSKLDNGGYMAVTDDPEAPHPEDLLATILATCRFQSSEEAKGADQLIAKIAEFFSDTSNRPKGVMSMGEGFILQAAGGRLFSVSVSEATTPDAPTPKKKPEPIKRGFSHAADFREKNRLGIQARAYKGPEVKGGEG